MLNVLVQGSNISAAAAYWAGKRAGLNMSWQPHTDAADFPAHTLPANLSRIIQALGFAEALADIGHTPDRMQMRFAQSGYLLCELPLGEFTRQRYGAPLYNVETAALQQLLTPPVQDPNGQLDLQLLCYDEGYDEGFGESHDDQAQQPNTNLWCARLAEQANARANVTWWAPGRCAWQFATREATHVMFYAPHNDVLVPDQWHVSLREAVINAKPTHTIAPLQDLVAQQWYQGNRVGLGAACYPSNPFRREAALLGIEDAWVLSRMLENYEDELATGLSEYEKYRRPRARRVQQSAVKLAQACHQTAVWRRGLGYIGSALSTRFLPEIAMQQQDWLYQYDCIRGFR